MKPVIGIVGGAGRMGVWFSRFFTDRGYPVLVSDLNEGVPLSELLTKAQIVIVTVPISVTPQVLESIVPQLRADQLIMDLTSLKVDPLRVMDRAAGEVVGLHPMFGPDMHTIKGQTLVVCESRGGALWAEMLDAFEAAEVVIVRTSAEQHDRMMAIVQGLNHFHAIVFAYAMKELGISPEETLSFASPIYTLRMQMMGRVLAQDPRLYAEIETLNPFVPAALQAFCTSAQKLAEIVERKDAAAFEKVFTEASEHLGSFREEALRESSRMLEYALDQKK